MSLVGTPASANSRVIATRFRRSTPRNEKPCISGAIRVDKDAGSSPTTPLTLLLPAPFQPSLAPTARRISHRQDRPTDRRGLGPRLPRRRAITPPISASHDGTA